MSDPIDYIDLTVDSPFDKSLNIRNRNTANVPNNSRTTKSRKRNSKQQSVQCNDSVIELPLENNTCKDAQVTEIIDVDSINIPEKNDLCYINDSTQGNLVVLTCPICYEQLSSKMRPMSTRCGHIFCSQCLQLALSKAKRCPTCKKANKWQTCTRLYF